MVRTNMLLHQQVVPKEHEEGPVDGVQGAPNRVAQPPLLDLVVDEDLHVLSRVEVTDGDLRPQGCMLPPSFDPRGEVLSGSGDHVDAMDARFDGFVHEVGQDRHVHQRERLFRKHRARGKHPCPKATGHDERVLDGGHSARRVGHPFKHGPAERGMASGWVGWAVAGVLLVLQTFVDVVPDGPWGSAAIGRGGLGLIGLGCLYLAWFRRTFGDGFLPTLDRWQDPRSTWATVVAAGLLALLLARASGLGWMPAAWPEPAGLVLSLIGLLLLLNGLYVAAVVHVLDEEE